MNRFLASIALGFLFWTIPKFTAAAEGQKYSIDLVDVDGNTFSTSDGHVTLIVLTTQSGTNKAHLVADRTPDFCLGNPEYRMVTVLVFEKKHSNPTRMIFASLMRRRLDFEGHRLQSRYDNLKISHPARRDVSAVADFDGNVAKQLGIEPAAGVFHVFVFGKRGELVKSWDDVPPADELSAALQQN